MPKLPIEVHVRTKEETLEPLFLGIMPGELVKGKFREVGVLQSCALNGRHLVAFRVKLENGLTAVVGLPDDEFFELALKISRGVERFRREH